MFVRGAAAATPCAPILSNRYAASARHLGERDDDLN
jgi:hypothetical protein